MNYLKAILFGIVVFLIVLFIVNLLIGVNERTSVCYESQTSIQCEYKTFDGTSMTNQDINKIKVHKGEVLYVVYNAIVKTGELSLDAILTRLNNNNKDESVWSNTLKNNRSETINIPINDDGEVIFRIKGTKKSGSYNIKCYVKSKDEAAKK